MSAGDEAIADRPLVPTRCACGNPHPCYRCWPDRPPPWVDLEAPRLFDLE